MCSLSLWDSFLLLCRFLTFFKILRMFTIDAGFGENCAVFKWPLFTEWAFYLVAFLVCYIAVLLTLFTAITVIIFIRNARVWTVNHFLELFFLCLAFSFFFWMTGELVRTLYRNFSLPLMALRLTILVGVFPWETRLGAEEWADAGVKTCHFNTFFNT
jgi:hypothetical protein